MWAGVAVGRVLLATFLGPGPSLEGQSKSLQGVSRMGHDSALIWEWAGVRCVSLVPGKRLHFHWGKIS